MIDACSLINLHKGGVLDVVLQLKDHEFFVDGFVDQESGSFLQPYYEQGLLTKLSDENVPSSAFSAILSRYDLGFGETECIVFAKMDNTCVCSDDLRARKATKSELGDGRVIGTLFLLRECVRSGVLTPDAARGAYELMRTKGAFLPDLEDDYFDIEPADPKVTLEPT
jgi:predicted nucleic acid-binding protein